MEILARLLARLEMRADNWNEWNQLPGRIRLSGAELMAIITVRSLAAFNPLKAPP